MAKIKITVGDESYDANLDEETAPETVGAILDALPIEAPAKAWGEEFYFDIPVDVGLENEVETVSVGDLAYWPHGNAFCIFFGKTPMSPSEEEIVPASPVNPVGTIENAEALKSHVPGEQVRISPAN